jgi:trimeric autotransporter adhesin
MKPKLYMAALITISLFFCQQIFSQANTALSNLVSPTAVNRDLSPGSNNTLNLGVGATNWKNIYIGSLYYLKNLRIMHAPGTSNFFAGPNAGNLATTGTFNAGIGNQAMELNTTGSNNTALGYTALRNNTLGGRNVAVGLQALYNNTSGGYNTAIGERTMYLNKAGIYNTAIGSTSLYSNTTGASNTGLGYRALYANTTGYSNVAIGVAALSINTTGSGTIAIGDSALLKNNNNYHNVAVGSKALMNTTTGYYNVAVGYQALYSNTVSGYNTALGYQALYATTGSAYDNTGTGYQALYATTTGSRNTANGVWALLNNTTGSNNVADGVYALQLNTTGSDNVASGFYAAFYSKGSSNVAIGSHALFTNSGGNNLVAIGDSALYNQNGGSGFNTAIGSKASYSNTTGTYQTAVGYQALYKNTASYSNTAVGYQAMYSNTTGSYNTGYGLYANFGNTTGSFNVGIGLDALNRNFTGSSNTALGSYANVNVDGLTNATAIGYNAIATASNQVVLGSTSVTSVKAAGSFVIYSDGRYKKDVNENVPGLAFINMLRPVTYHYDITGLNKRIGAKADNTSSRQADKEADAAERTSPAEDAAISVKEKKLYTGFVAQEVDAAAKKLNYDFSGVYQPQGENDAYGLSYSDFVVPLVKAIQELTARDSAKDAKIYSLMARIENLESVLKIPSSVNSSLSSSSVGQNSPNPFRGNTVISYNVPQGLNTAQIVVYDAAGKTLKQINISGQGRGTVNLDATTLPSGTYHYSLYINGKVVDTKKMVLIK